MPTRHGWILLVAAGATAVIGRVFGILELFVIAAGAAAACAVAWAVVATRMLDLAARRWIHPPILTVGDTGRVDVTIGNPGRRRSPTVRIVEPVGAADSARIEVAPLRSGDQVDAAYRLPATRRGVLTVGPMVLEHRDRLGLAVAWRTIAPSVEVVVAPRAHELPMPDLGRGVLGRHLLTQAQRMGAGEFHSLREYVAGDEPRLINWRASARSTELMVRQHTTEGVRRCIVVLDSERAGVRAGDDTTAADAAFERAVTAAASLVSSADRAGLTTRFVTGGGIDLRGPDVAANTLRVLAAISPGDSLGEVERDPGEGLGLLVVVTATAGTPTWRRTDGLLDPSLTRVGVFTGAAGAGSGATAPQVGRLGVDASTEERFVDGWTALAGRGGLDVRSRLVQRDPQPVP